MESSGTTASRAKTLRGLWCYRFGLPDFGALVLFADTREAVDRDEALRCLERAELVIHGPNAWERREGARLSFADSKPPLIEV